MYTLVLRMDVNFSVYNTQGGNVALELTLNSWIIMVTSIKYLVTTMILPLVSWLQLEYTMV